jgi:hypothetical protein
MGKTLWLRGLLATALICFVAYFLATFWPQVHNVAIVSVVLSPIMINIKPIILWLKDLILDHVVSEFVEVKRRLDGLERELTLNDVAIEKMRDRLLDLVSAEHRIMDEKLEAMRQQINGAENEAIRAKTLVQATGAYRLGLEFSTLQGKVAKLEEDIIEIQELIEEFKANAIPTKIIPRD